MGNQYVTYLMDDRVATVVLNNPPANVLTLPLLTELDAVLGELAVDHTVRAIVLTGAGNVFVAGADVRVIANIASPAEGEALAKGGQAIFFKIEQIKKPIIAAISGFCLGGGMELAMACHIRVAGERAKLGQPEINLGIIPGFGGTQRLPRLVGVSKAMEMILTGDMINATEARAIGLVDKIVPEGEVLKQAQGLARKIASKGRKAVLAALSAIQGCVKQPVEEGFSAEAALFGEICETEDMREGVSAFLEKRQPKFQD